MRILVADDHALFRAGLRHLLVHLADEIHITEAGSCDDLLDRLSKDHGFELVLIDLLMPGMESFGRIQEICDRSGGAPVVVVSVRDRAEDVEKALKAGAAGYIPKSSNPEVMINALKLVMSGGVYVPPNVLRLHRQVEPWDVAVGGSGEDGGSVTRLTGRQREVMALLAQGKSNKEIASDLGLAAGTVKIHISNIFKALNVRNRTQAVIAAGEILAGSSRDLSQPV